MRRELPKSKRAHALKMILVIMITLPMIMIAHCADPVIHVSPSVQLVRFGEEFEVDINVDYVENIYGFEVWMSFDKNILNASHIEERGFLNLMTTIWYQEVDNTGGYVTIAVTSLRPAPAKSGGSPPPLATVRFKAIGIGNSTLHLYKTKLVDNQTMAISHTATDGEVTVTGTIGHEVALTSVVTCKDGCEPVCTVCEGYTAHVNITALNLGTFTESFSVTLYANATVIVVQSVTNLPPGNKAILTFLLNTTGYTIDAYLLSAYAAPVSGETNMTDNTFIGRTIKVTILGDINGDNKVDMKDVGVAARGFGTNFGDLGYNGNADLDDDHDVDMKDIGATSRHFGDTYP